MKTLRANYLQKLYFPVSAHKIERGLIDLKTTCTDEDMYQNRNSQSENYMYNEKLTLRFNV